MKKIIILTLTIISIIACKKENTTTENTPLYLIKTITVFNNNGFSTTYIDSFYYDAQNRLTNQLHKDGSSRHLNTYHYFTDSITLTGYNAANPSNIVRLEKHLLLANGLASKSILYNYNGMNYVANNITDNIYNNEKYVSNGTTVDYFLGTNVYNFTNIISNGNITKTTKTYTTSSKLDTTFYEFDLAHLNTLGNENYGKSFLGKSNKNLVTKETHKTNGDTKEISLFSYKFDDKDRVVEETKTTTRYNNGTMLPAYINRTNVTYY